MAKQFKLDGRMYEFVTKAEDHSHFQAGEIGIFRLPGTQQYFTMPMSELIARMQDDSADWARRLALFKTRFVNRTDVYAKRYFKDGHKKYSPAGPFEHGRPSLKVHYPLTDDIIRRHLDTKTDFAIWPLPARRRQQNQVPRARCRWPSSDPVVASPHDINCQSLPSKWAFAADRIIAVWSWVPCVVIL